MEIMAIFGSQKNVRLAHMRFICPKFPCAIPLAMILMLMPVLCVFARQVHMIWDVGAPVHAGMQVRMGVCRHAFYAPPASHLP